MAPHPVTVRPSRSGRARSASAAAVLGGLVLWAGGTFTAACFAQLERHTPTLRYQAAFSDFYEGEYGDALDVFRDEARGAIKTPQSRWIDSICYETMVGECYYQMGRLREALDHYTAALTLYSAFSDWMIRVNFPPAIRPSSRQVQIPWGSSTRQSRQGQYPAEMLTGQGRIDNNEAFQRGGVVQQAILYPIQVQEIVRCTTLAIRRRAELLGPVAPHDPLTAEVLARLQRRPGPPNHWSEAWIDVELGLALSAAGKTPQAVQHLQRGLVAAGEFDHPLTSIALLELGRIAMSQANYPAALKWFEEATYAAVFYPDLGVLEEAFRGAALAYQLAARKGVYQPLAVAANWAKVKGYRQLEASLRLSLAENYAALGEPARAGGVLDQASRAIGRRRMGQGVIGNRLTFLRAMVLFQQKRPAEGEGDAALATSMQFMQHGSFWLFHISLVDALYTSGAASPRVAEELYELVLRDPQPIDWTYSPVESLASLVTPHPLPLEHWFEVTLARRNHEKALEVADRARRHRFFSSLPFGGRLAGLRWILEGPPTVLSDQARGQRRDLATDYPLYEQLGQQAQALRRQIRSQPLVADNQQRLIEQGKQLEELAGLSLHREAILREIAVSRKPGELAFPPLRTTGEIQQSLGDGQAMLAFFLTSRRLYAFLMNNKNYAYWEVGSPQVVSRKLVELLREMGHYQQNNALSLKELAGTKWKQTAKELLDALLEGSRADFTQDFDELIVVPDGLMWYVPFEALQVEMGGQLRPLISRFKVRYAPTASLATPVGFQSKPSGVTGVVAGRLYPQDNPAVAQQAFADLARVLPGAVALGDPLPAPSGLYAALFDRLIVLDDMTFSNPSPYGWSPLPIDAGKAGSTLADWLSLPFGGPEAVILPGFHTAAESSLKGGNPASAGQEMFLSVCGLMSSGSQTLLLSRWRPGGRTSFDFVREFAQELPHTSPAEAYQRAVFLTAASRLDLDAEPRVKRAATDQPPKAQHPFFWAAYMLVDSGTSPHDVDAPPAPGPDQPPAIEVQQPGGAPPPPAPPADEEGAPDPSRPAARPDASPLPFR